MRRLITIISVLIFANVFPLYAEKDAGNYIAVFNIVTTGAVDKDLSLPLSESIRHELVMSHKYKVLDRSTMNGLLGDGCMTGQCMVKPGQLPGVEKIITGSVSKLGNTYYLSLSLINLQTGNIEAISEETCKCEVDDLIEASKKLAQRLLGKKVTGAQSTPARQPANKAETP